MNRESARRLLISADAILQALTNRQYLHPHESLGRAIQQVQEDLHVCPQAARKGVDWLRFDPQASIGRLRRSELSQLANSIHRFWRRTSLPAPGGLPLAELH